MIGSEWTSIRNFYQGSYLSFVYRMLQSYVFVVALWTNFGLENLTNFIKLYETMASSIWEFNKAEIFFVQLLHFNMCFQHLGL